MRGLRGNGEKGRIVRGRIAITSGIVLLALSGCKRGQDEQNALYHHNSQTGVMTTKQGVEVNVSSVSEGCLTPEEARQNASALGRERSRQILSCMNAASVRQMNPQLPIVVDAMTRMDRVSSDGPSITYHYSFTVSAAALPPGALWQMESRTRGIACSQPPMLQAMEMGGSFTYRLIDNQGVLAHQFTIDACTDAGSVLAQ